MNTVLPYRIKREAREIASKYYFGVRTIDSRYEKLFHCPCQIVFNRKSYLIPRILRVRQIRREQVFAKARAIRFR